MAVTKYNTFIPQVGLYPSPFGNNNWSHRYFIWIKNKWYQQTVIHPFFMNPVKCMKENIFNRSFIVYIYDVLFLTASRSLLHASHFCYLMAQIGLGTYNKKATKMVLLGASHRWVTSIKINSDIFYLSFGKHFRFWIFCIDLVAK